MVVMTVMSLILMAAVVMVAVVNDGRLYHMRDVLIIIMKTDVTHHVYSNNNCEFPVQYLCKMFLPFPLSWEGRSTEWSYVTEVPSWLHLGASVVGGCCRIGPADIRDIASIVAKSSSS